MNASFFKRRTPDRYYVDERVGCVAVRDRTVRSDTVHCAPDLPGVVFYWRGVPTREKCPWCGHEKSSHLKVKEEDVESARQLCEEMNHGR